MPSKLLNPLRLTGAAMATIGLLVCVCGSAQAPADKTKSGQAPLAHGSVEGGAYVDPRFGLRYTFPDSLEVQTSLNGMAVGTGQKTATANISLLPWRSPLARCAAESSSRLTRLARLRSPTSSSSCA
jgi:hypothetical protein